MPLVNGVLMRAWEPQFRKRFEVPQPPVTIPEHQWQVDVVDETTVSIAAGKIIGLKQSTSSSPPGFPFRAVGYAFTGQDYTISGACWLYAIVSGSSVPIFDNGTVGNDNDQVINYAFEPSGVTIADSTNAPSAYTGGSGTQVVFPICELVDNGGPLLEVDQWQDCSFNAAFPVAHITP